MLLTTLTSILQPLFNDAIARKVTPGGVVLVGQKAKTLGHEAFGTVADGSDPTLPDTIYDAASLTKSVVTSCLLMGLVAEGRLSLDTDLLAFLPELKASSICLKHLLGHGSGLPAHLHFYRAIRAGERAGAPDRWNALVTMAGREALSYPTGTTTIYSDLGYILLAKLIERICDDRLDSIFQRKIAKPLGMVDSGFVDLQAGTKHPKLLRVAPTRQIDSRQLLHGEVHDDNCHAGGGISGHAGLFTTATDLAILAATLCQSYHGRGGFIPAAVLRSFWTTAAAPKTSWRMGWDTPSSVPGLSHAGDHWPASGIGHLGYTGTAWWLAPEQERFVIILTNRVYYSCEKDGIKALRRSVMHAQTRMGTAAF